MKKLKLIEILESQLNHVLPKIDEEKNEEAYME
jgi:hypothetical protein